MHCKQCNAMHRNDMQRKALHAIQRNVRRATRCHLSGDNALRWNAILQCEVMLYNAMRCNVLHNCEVTRRVIPLSSKERYEGGSNQWLVEWESENSLHAHEKQFRRSSVCAANGVRKSLVE